MSETFTLVEGDSTITFTASDGETFSVVESNPSSAAGVTDHGDLTGLSDDDHTNYLNNARGDARYWQLSTGMTRVLGGAGAGTLTALTTSDQSIASLSIAGDTLTTGDELNFTLSFTGVQTSGGTLVWTPKVVLGSSSTSLALSLTNSASNRTFQITGTIRVLSSSTAALAVQFLVGVTGTTSQVSQPPPFEAALTGLDFTASQTLDLTIVSAAATATQNFTRGFFSVRKFAA